MLRVGTRALRKQDAALRRNRVALRPAFSATHPASQGEHTGSVHESRRPFRPAFSKSIARAGSTAELKVIADKLCQDAVSLSGSELNAAVVELARKGETGLARQVVEVMVAHRQHVTADAVIAISLSFPAHPARARADFLEHALTLGVLPSARFLLHLIKHMPPSLTLSRTATDAIARGYVTPAVLRQPRDAIDVANCVRPTAPERAREFAEHALRTLETDNRAFANVRMAHCTALFRNFYNTRQWVLAARAADMINSSSGGERRGALVREMCIAYLNASQPGPAIALARMALARRHSPSPGLYTLGMRTAMRQGTQQDVITIARHAFFVRSMYAESLVELLTEAGQSAGTAGAGGDAAPVSALLRSLLCLWPPALPQAGMLPALRSQLAAASAVPQPPTDGGGGGGGGPGVGVARGEWGAAVGSLGDASGYAAFLRQASSLPHCFTGAVVETAMEGLTRGGAHAEALAAARWAVGAGVATPTVADVLVEACSVALKHRTLGRAPEQATFAAAPAGARAASRRGLANDAWQRGAAGFDGAGFDGAGFDGAGPSAGAQRFAGDHGGAPGGKPAEGAAERSASAAAVAEAARSDEDVEEGSGDLAADGSADDTTVLDGTYDAWTEGQRAEAQAIVRDCADVVAAVGLQSAVRQMPATARHGAFVCLESPHQQRAGARVFTEARRTLARAWSRLARVAAACGAWDVVERGIRGAECEAPAVHDLCEVALHAFHDSVGNNPYNGSHWHLDNVWQLLATRAELPASARRQTIADVWSGKYRKLDSIRRGNAREAKKGNLADLYLPRASPLHRKDRLLAVARALTTVQAPISLSVLQRFAEIVQSGGCLLTTASVAELTARALAMGLVDQTLVAGRARLLQTRLPESVVTDAYELGVDSESPRASIGALGPDWTVEDECRFLRAWSGLEEVDDMPPAFLLLYCGLDASRGPEATTRSAAREPRCRAEVERKRGLLAKAHALVVDRAVHAAASQSGTVNSLSGDADASPESLNKLRARPGSLRLGEPMFEPRRYVAPGVPCSRTQFKILQTSVASGAGVPLSALDLRGVSDAARSIFGSDSLPKQLSAATRTRRAVEKSLATLESGARQWVNILLARATRIPYVYREGVAAFAMACDGMLLPRATLSLMSPEAQPSQWMVETMIGALCNRRLAVGTQLYLDAHSEDLRPSDALAGRALEAALKIDRHAPSIDLVLHSCLHHYPATGPAAGWGMVSALLDRDRVADAWAVALAIRSDVHAQRPESGVAADAERTVRRLCDRRPPWVPQSAVDALRAKLRALYEQLRAQDLAPWRFLLRVSGPGPVPARVAVPVRGTGHVGVFPEALERSPSISTVLSLDAVRPDGLYRVLLRHVSYWLSQCLARNFSPAGLDAVPHGGALVVLLPRPADNGPPLRRLVEEAVARGEVDVPDAWEPAEVPLPGERSPFEQPTAERVVELLSRCGLQGTLVDDVEHGVPGVVVPQAAGVAALRAPGERSTVINHVLRQHATSSDIEFPLA